MREPSKFKGKSFEKKLKMGKKTKSCEKKKKKNQKNQKNKNNNIQKYKKNKKNKKKDAGTFEIEGTVIRKKNKNGKKNQNLRKKKKKTKKTKKTKTTKPKNTKKTKKKKNKDARTFEIEGKRLQEIYKIENFQNPTCQCNLSVGNSPNYPLVILQIIRW